ncbi:hypothetical protein Pfo_019231 [Paulownia fortunei]|nr:hypothetical protein Pfo_019231 [Paulownia fortunei]
MGSPLPKLDVSLCLYTLILTLQPHPTPPPLTTKKNQLFGLLGICCYLLVFLAPSPGGFFWRESFFF